jgi:ribosomal protein L28
VQYQPLHSEALQRKIYLTVTTDALKRIDRAGGLDMYLLTNPMAARGSIVAEQLRGLVQAVRAAC